MTPSYKNNKNLNNKQDTPDRSATSQHRQGLFHVPQPPNRNHTPSHVAAKTLYSVLFPIASDLFPTIHLEGHGDDSVPVRSSVASGES